MGVWRPEVLRAQNPHRPQGAPCRGLGTGSGEPRWRCGNFYAVTRRGPLTDSAVNGDAFGASRAGAWRGCKGAGSTPAFPRSRPYSVRACWWASGSSRSCKFAIAGRGHECAGPARRPLLVLRFQARSSSVPGPKACLRAGQHSDPTSGEPTCCLCFGTKPTGWATALRYSLSEGWAHEY